MDQELIIPEPFPATAAGKQVVDEFFAGLAGEGSGGIPAEFDVTELEQEYGGRRRMGARAVPARHRSAGSAAGRRPPFRGPRPRRGSVYTGLGPRARSRYPDLYPDFDSGGAVTQGAEHVRWIQDCLNHAMSARLPVDGVMSPATRSLVRSFQRRHGLRQSGIVGPDTQDALRAACAGTGAAASPDAVDDGELAWGNEDEASVFADVLGRIGHGISSGIGSAVGWAAGALGDNRIIDLTAKADKSKRKGTRPPGSVYALVLHQMACCFQPRDPLTRFLSLSAHFAILADGRILQLHPVSALVWASNGFNKGSVAVEFAGNFPNTAGKWWQGDKFGRNRLTKAQVEAGRYLVRYLMRTMGLKVVLAHRQSSGTRENDPGPDIWSQVGQWALNTLGLKDGGPGFKVGSGNPIPDAWRSWGQAGVARESFEMGEQGQPWPEEFEAEWAGEVSFPRAIADARANGPGVYTLYKGGQRLYVGKASNLRQRLQQHLLCVTHLGIDANQFTVKLTPMPGADATKLSKVEAATIDKWGQRKRGGQLTNVKARELELESWGVR
jgi:hypothetical protein